MRRHEAWKRSKIAASAAVSGALTVLLGLIGCQSATNTFQAPPPPEVTVAHPVRQTVPTELTFTGEIEGVETVEIRARVRGFIQTIHFEPGSLVARDQLLFTIDPREYEANLRKAEADLRGKQAEYRLARIELEKSKTLLRRNATTETEVRQREAEELSARASVALAEATLELAKLDLSYTRVTSPIDGAIGENLVDVGALVGASDPTLLANVIRTDEVFAYFNISDRDLLNFMDRYPEANRPKTTEDAEILPESEIQAQVDAIAEAATAIDPDDPPADDPEATPDSAAETPDPDGDRPSNDPANAGGADRDTPRYMREGNDVPIFLARDNDRGFPFEGRFDSADNTVDSSTGTLRLRARFDNPNSLLYPGLIIRVRIPITENEALLVPAVAVTADQRGRFVLVVDDDNNVLRKGIELGAQFERNRVVLPLDQEDPLTTDDWVIVNGIQRARPGAQVNPIRPGETTAPASDSPETTAQVEDREDSPSNS